jgi:uncharacterized protein (TIGR00730 family)
MNQTAPTGKLKSVCLFCGSSNAADPAYLEAAAEFGRTLTANGVRLVYGGGGIGLMGAAAKASHNSGGKVLGIMPEFLRHREVIYDDVETIVVDNMTVRKKIMFEQSDAFVVMPGGVGTLEEVVELISWRRLELHFKPIVFVNIKGFWDPFFALIDHTVAEKVTPDWVPGTWGIADTVGAVLPMCERMLEAAPDPVHTRGEVVSKGLSEG